MLYREAHKEDYAVDPLFVLNINRIVLNVLWHWWYVPDLRRTIPEKMPLIRITITNKTESSDFLQKIVIRSFMDLNLQYDPTNVGRAAYHCATQPSLLYRLQNCYRRFVQHLVTHMFYM